VFEHGMELDTLAGGTLQVTIDNDSIQVNNVAIEDPVLAANGVLFTIRKLLYPAWYTQSFTDVLFTIQSPIERCLELLETSGIMEDIILPLDAASTLVPFTVFCPTNEAFDMFGSPEVLDDPVQLRTLMNYHLMRDNYVLGFAKLQTQKKKTFQTGAWRATTTRGE
jgi:uncharacterized surface protein with fasciclin (FAS1) repeats